MGDRWRTFAAAKAQLLCIVSSQPDIERLHVVLPLNLQIAPHADTRPPSTPPPPKACVAHISKIRPNQVLVQSEIRRRVNVMHEAP